MKLITVAGPPSSGKTSVIGRALEFLRGQDVRFGVIKFDCLSTDDDNVYLASGVPAIKGLSGVLCPDHYFVSNVDSVFAWAKKKKIDTVVVESAGLCNRCSPHIRGCLAVCVVDNMSGLHTPKKIGPMLKLSDIAVITKGDIVSQAEREVFSFRVQKTAPRARLMTVNGRTGQGAAALARAFCEAPNRDDASASLKLRFPMPAALCSYCLGETRVAPEYQIGQFRKLSID
jgi:Ni2+-binding GTPase involved in maturation of urease and hydrogenase